VQLYVNSCHELRNVGDAFYDTSFLYTIDNNYHEIKDGRRRRMNIYKTFLFRPLCLLCGRMENNLSLMNLNKYNRN
jgi:hypothetical protein